MTNFKQSSKLTFKQAFMTLSENEFKLFLSDQKYSLETLTQYLTQTNGFRIYDEKIFKAHECKQKILMDIIEQLSSTNTSNQTFSHSNSP